MAALEDIAPALLEQLQEDFRERIQNDPQLAAILSLIKEGKATYIEAEEFAHEVGILLSQSFGQHISSAILPDGKMYYNIADRVIRPMLEEDHQLVVDVATQVQQSLNRKANIGLKAQAAPLNEDRIYGIVNKVSEAEFFDDVAWVLREPVVNFSQAVVDDTIKANVNFQGKAGLRPKIIREAESKCCEWCSRLAGQYDYPMVPDDIYRRHGRCRCTVDYDPGDGRRQNVHSKQWKKQNNNARIETKQTGAETGGKKTEGWAQRHAERYYEEVRNRTAYSDARRIAQNVSGFSIDQIEEIRQHVFIREQPRSDGMARFDPDYDMAQAWQRLVDGKDIRHSDIVLLKHEHEELTIMSQTGCIYEEAHEKADEKYNWWRTVMEEG